MKQKTAVIDIGSNTIRLVIYDYEQDKGMKEIENIKTAARLRTYLDANGVMEREGIETLITTLHAFKEIIEYHHLTDIRIAATAAIRQAKNQLEIVKEVEETTGFRVTILSENEEAYYGYLAVVHTTPIDSAVTVDIGGGSTEVTYFENKQLKYSHSFAFGVVSLKKDFMSGEKMTAEEKQNLSRFLVQQFYLLPWLKNKNVPIIAIGGSARNIALIDQHVRNYPIAGVHQYWMTREALFTIKDELITMNRSQLEKLDGLSSDRIDIIAPSAEVFCQLYDVVQAKGFMFSRKGLRDGLMLKELMSQFDAPLDREHVFQNSLKELSFEYSVDKESAEQMMYIALELYEQLSELGFFDYREDLLLLLKRGAYLYYLGEYIDSDSVSQHTFYLIANRSIDGVLHRDRIKIAALASFKNKSTLKQFLVPFTSWFTKEEMQQMRELGALLKFAYSLNSSKRDIVKQLEVGKNDSGLTITVYATGNTLAEEYQAEKQKKHLEKSIKTTIDLVFIDIH
ncbi:Ppx/GppA family phosphatase [Jeotgalibacillus soli]|uniref:Uncharacterized protein n=1 Tax=Jeotgalibacillus soli TaxID=889306 RepID=A0A0C2R362_9BACL|nr:Ppx/GppA family phosphatase [Jeotgalibacillus soli]KIL44700.1 hypothetical protein KP78_22440 [Jeotgalibacillus soli]